MAADRGTPTITNLTEHERRLVEVFRRLAPAQQQVL